MDYAQFIEEVLQGILFKIGSEIYEYFRNYWEKRENKELTKQEIEYFVKGYVEGDVADYQAAALVMAIFLMVWQNKK